MLTLASTALGGFRMLPNGCSYYETHHLGGCQRLAAPRAECSAGSSRTPHRPNLAIVVPARRADASLLCTRLAAHFGRFAARYHIFVVSQVDSLPFNRGALANAAVTLLLRGDGQAGRHGRTSFDYLAIHDIDRFPAVDNRSCDRATSQYYEFPEGPPRALHPMSFAGGVLVVRTALYRAVNGFSNDYWGYGEEDNDLFLRLRWCGLPPRHGPELDSCMEHRDCDRCKREKKSLPSDLLGSQLERARRRMRRPRHFMQRDGLSTVNFTVVRHVVEAPCGGPGVPPADFIDVRLRRHRPKPTGGEAFQGGGRGGGGGTKRSRRSRI